MSPTSAGGGANIITSGEHISPASLKRQEEVLPTAKLEQRRYKKASANHQMMGQMPFFSV